MVSFVKDKKQRTQGLSYSNILLTSERQLIRQKLLTIDFSLKFLKTGTADANFQQSGKHNSFKQYQKDKLIICMDGQVHSLEELPLEYNQNQNPQKNQDWL